MCTLVLLPPFLTYSASVFRHELEHQSHVVILDLLILAQLPVEVQIFDFFV
jgi:hypothetical protein